VTINEPENDQEFILLYQNYRRFRKALNEKPDMTIDPMLASAQFDGILSVANEMREALDSYADKWSMPC
jgi:hypothetical protein